VNHPVKILPSLSPTILPPLPNTSINRPNSNGRALNIAVLLHRNQTTNTMYNDNNISNKRDNNRAFLGLFLVGLGAIYLLRQLDFFFFPSWLFSWPMILIVVGIASGIKHNWRNTGAYVMIAIGSMFLLGHVLAISICYFWPLILIVIGVRMLFGKNYWHDNGYWESKTDYHNHNRVNL